MASTYSIIGQPMPARVDGTGKVTGVTRYADDLFLPRMLYGKLLRSPHPYARIIRLDTSKTAALPGVLAVITGADLPQPYSIMPVNQDEHALAIDKVRYVGDPVASAPLRVPDLVGQRLTAEAIDAAAQVVFRPAKPLDNTDLTLAYRKKMVRVHVTRVLRQLAGLPVVPYR